MSAPLRLTAHHVKQLGEALERLSKTTRETGVSLVPYGPAEVALAGNVIRISWDEDAEAYVIDDQNGA